MIGLDKYLHIGMGFCSGLVAIIFLVWWALWNTKLPPLTPFLTTSFVGFFIDFWNYVAIDQITTLMLSPYSLLILGLLICSYASSLIIMSGIGIRIMDLVALTMIQKWNWNFFSAKMILEIGLFSTGWMLGGPVGTATLAFLFLVGPLIQPFMQFNSYFFKIENFGIKAL